MPQVNLIEKLEELKDLAIRKVQQDHKTIAEINLKIEAIEQFYSRIVIEMNLDNRTVMVEMPD